MTSLFHRRSAHVVVVTLLFQMLSFLDTSPTVNALPTAAEEQEILAIHNILRAGEGASNMQIMTWDSTLALIAQNWSDNCDFSHGVSINSSTLSNLNMGQNIYGKSSGPANLTAAVISWFNEKVDWFYSNNSCASNKVCGHYTQVVWAASNKVGCGYSICPSLAKTSWTNAVFIVCNYAPAGNMASEMPYQMGPACAKCASGSFYCNQGLCDSSCTAPSSTCVCQAACQNCNTQTADCQCQCGAGWGAVDCSEVCQDKDTRCGNGWYSNWCTTMPYVLKGCPAMCGACVVGTPAPCITTANPAMSTTTPAKPPAPPSSNPSGSAGSKRAPARGACLMVTSSEARMISGPNSVIPRVIAKFKTGAKFFSKGESKVGADGTQWWKVSSVRTGIVGWIQETYLARLYATYGRKYKKSKLRRNRKFKC